MLLVLKRTAPQTHVKIDGYESIYNFTLKNFFLSEPVILQ